MAPPRTVGYWEVVAIGVGGMVGGGIFAVLGLAVQFSHGGTPVAFAVGGLVALLTTYSYVKLSVAFPSQGGTVTFIDRAFGSGLLTGSLNILIWQCYIIMLSLYAYAFGSYGATFLPHSFQPAGKHLLTSGIILAISGLNMFGAKIIGRAESWIVAVKVAILLFFVVAGFRGIDTNNLSISAWSPPLNVISGGMIVFLAYEGFELIANTAQDVKRPNSTLPRAYYSAVFFVILLYILVSVVTVGSLSVSQIVDAKDYALAEAAKPFLGKGGFVLIVIAALLSTASAINATLYGAARLSYTIAKDGELPAFLEKKVWNKPIEGLCITSGLTLFVSNTFDLSSISMMGSAGFLLVFAAVNGGNLRIFKTTQSRWWIPAAGLVMCIASLTALLWQTVITSPKKLWILMIMLVVAFVVECSYRIFKKRVIHLSHRR